MVKAVLFDMDGVLLDTEKHLAKYWCQAAEEFGFDMSWETALSIRSLAAKYAEPYLKDILGEGFDYAKVRERRRELVRQELERSGIEKKPEVEFLLAELKARKIKTVITTASDEVRMKDYLSRAGLYGKFDDIVCATMVETGKPAPDIYLYACQAIGERAEDCLAVEDSPNGVLAAVRAGIRTIMVPDLSKPDQELKKVLYGVADTLRDVLFYLD